MAEFRAKDADKGVPGGDRPEPSDPVPPDGAPEPIVDPDAELVERCRKGQPAAFDMLVRRYQDRVYNLAFRYLREPEVAEEIAQDVFVAVYKHVKTFQGNSKFSTWLFRIVANHCHNKSKYLRRRKHRQQDSIDRVIETEDGELRLDLPDDPALSPEELSVRRSQNEAIQAAIGALDDDHRIIVLLRDVEDLSYEEIAEALNLPEGTVKSRLHRARNELRERLSKKT